MEYKKLLRHKRFCLAFSLSLFCLSMGFILLKSTWIGQFSYNPILGKVDSFGDVVLEIIIGFWVWFVLAGLYAAIIIVLTEPLMCISKSMTKNALDDVFEYVAFWMFPIVMVSVLVLFLLHRFGLAIIFTPLLS